MRKIVLVAAVAMGDYCFNDPSSGVKIQIALDGKNINVNASSPQQWVGFGVPKSADFTQMGKGNFVIGSGNTIYERTDSSDSNGKPTQTAKLTTSSSSSSSNGMTSMSFTRPLAPPGGNAIDATKPFHILWATGTVNKAANGFDGINYHGPTKGNFLVDFKNGNCGSNNAASGASTKPANATTTTTTTTTNPNNMAMPASSSTNTTTTTTASANPPPPTMRPGKAGKAGKGGKMKVAGKNSKVVCKAGRVPCTPDMQAMGMRCALNACVIPSPGGNAVMTVYNFAPLSNSQYNPNGTIVLKFFGSKLSLQYDLHRVDSKCVRKSSVANSCALIIQQGKTCQSSQLGGPFYANSTQTANASNPWIPVFYKSDNQGNANGVTNVDLGIGYNYTFGRALVIFDQNGMQIACGLIPDGTTGNSTNTTDMMNNNGYYSNGNSASPYSSNSASGTVVTVSNFMPYPGTNFNVRGSVVMKFINTSVSMDYHLQNADMKCTKVASVANSCGLHIHVGKTCTNNTEIAGHYYDNSTGVDPWLAATYLANNKGDANGATSVTYGYTYATSAGRAVVVHDQNGTRMACALIPQAGQSGQN